jgi:membrane-bound serine protease (ClpP class)
MEPFYLSIILLAVGFAIVFLEFFVPSAGLLGVLSAALIISGIVVAFFHSIGFGTAMLLLTVVMIPLVFAAMIKVWPHTPIGKRILIGDLSDDDVLPNDDHYTKLSQLVGQLGVAKTKMLPSGIVIIDGEKYDAVSDGFAIAANDTVKVVGIRANRIYVQPYDGDVKVDDDESARDPDVLSQPIDELGIDGEDFSLE